MGSAARTRVLLVDDHTLFRRGLASLLRTAPDFEVVGEAADGLDAIAQARSLQPDVILMDVRMPRVSGLEATRQILDTLPNAKILMLSMSEDEDTVLEALKSGALGYLLKTADPDELFGALRGLLRCEIPLSVDLAVKPQGSSRAGRTGPPPPLRAEPR